MPHVSLPPGLANRLTSAAEVGASSKSLLRQQLPALWTSLKQARADGTLRDALRPVIGSLLLFLLISSFCNSYIRWIPCLLCFRYMGSTTDSSVYAAATVGKSPTPRSLASTRSSRPSTSSHTSAARHAGRSAATGSGRPSLTASTPSTAATSSPSPPSSRRLQSLASPTPPRFASLTSTVKHFEVRSSRCTLTIRKD